ncbi:hypothetical protein TSTA_089940 [Talaromyces stipitatus ATCC 10500]|uniref:Uncharacterized protein n=1 Tax=Talaromyces stipitatus (strain ATCC 10500 / CBS 375.48 / QM 6759 / NRRL 1006) TaxID=441959 RepID=B8M0X5_TALSN|nr:uncharacterized protein TSTA_089940 [Talaromyces stipitatus ATCC 10500]EED21755.1 hypothetical protein TSTA_089940 [Talaromyces stipitatus ATCC 10500]
MDLTEGSRTAINVHLYLENERQTLYIQYGQEQGSDGVKTTKSPLEEYMHPPAELTDINFLTFLERVNFRNAKKWMIMNLIFMKKLHGLRLILFDPLQSRSDGTQEFWLELVLQLLGNNIEQIEDPDRLHHRDLDRAYD